MKKLFALVLFAVGILQAQENAVYWRVEADSSVESVMLSVYAKPRVSPFAHGDLIYDTTVNAILKLPKRSGRLALHEDTSSVFQRKIVNIEDTAKYYRRGSVIVTSNLSPLTQGANMGSMSNRFGKLWAMYVDLSGGITATSGIYSGEVKAANFTGSWTGDPIPWDKVIVPGIDGLNNYLPNNYAPLSHEHAWSAITSGKPTTLAGYGITDAVSTSDYVDWKQIMVTGIDKLSDYLPLNYAPISHDHAFSSLSSKPTTIAGYGISDLGWYDATHTGYYGVNIGGTGYEMASPTHKHAWSDLTANVPTTLAGYGITDAYFYDASVGGNYGIKLGGETREVAASTHTHTFASLTSKPTTIAGYGITDALSTSSYLDWSKVMVTGIDNLSIYLPLTFLAKTDSVALHYTKLAALGRDTANYGQTNTPNTWSRTQAFSGWVGIGTNTPQTSLDIVGNAQIRKSVPYNGTDTTTYLYIGGRNNTNDGNRSKGVAFRYRYNGASTNGTFSIAEYSGYDGTNTWALPTALNDVLTISGGAVGVTGALNVGGIITGSQLVLTTGTSGIRLSTNSTGGIGFNYGNSATGDFNFYGGGTTSVFGVSASSGNATFAGGVTAKDFVSNSTTGANFTFKRDTADQIQLFTEYNRYGFYNNKKGRYDLKIDYATGDATLGGALSSGAITSTGASSFGLNTKIDRTFQIKGASGSEYAYVDFRKSNDASVGYVGKGSGANDDVQLSAINNLKLYGGNTLGLTIGASGAATFANNVTLASTKQIGSDSATPGVMGTGWFINQNATIPTQSYMEIDNIRVRNNFNTHYFTKDVVKVIGNKTFMTRSGLVYKEMSDRLLLNTSKSDQLADGDLIEYRDGQGTFVQASVTSHSHGSTFDTYYLSFTSGSYDDFNVGGTVAVVSGNSILLDGNAPTIDLFGGVTAFSDLASSAKVKVRLGNLGGMTFGGQTIPANTYGLMTTNGYFKGEVLADSGIIGGWKTSAASFTKSGGTGAYTGIRAPSASTTNVFFAGASDTVGTGASFYVRANGELYASNATISGNLSLSSGSYIDFNYVSTNGQLPKSAIEGAYDWDGKTTHLTSTGVYTGTLSASQINAIFGISLGANATIDFGLVSKSGMLPKANVEGAATWDGKTTKLDANGIYTGTLTAAQVNAVAIDAGSITTGLLSADRISAGTLNGFQFTSYNGEGLTAWSGIGAGIGMTFNNTGMIASTGWQVTRTEYDSWNSRMTQTDKTSLWNAVSAKAEIADYLTSGSYTWSSDKIATALGGKASTFTGLSTFVDVNSEASQTGVFRLTFSNGVLTNVEEH